MNIILRNFGLDIDDFTPNVFYKSCEHMDDVNAGSVDLIVTSPPYGTIKNYGSDDQIGYDDDTIQQYFTRLNKVWNECYRVLKPTRRMIINVGDQFVRSAIRKYTVRVGGKTVDKTSKKPYHIIPIAHKIIDQCLEIGFDYLGAIIWKKISTTNTSGGCSLMGSVYYPRNGMIAFDYEYILIFVKRGMLKDKNDPYLMEMSKIPMCEWKKWYQGHWKLPPARQDVHVAMFPDHLPYRIIRMFTMIGDTVLDPFVGSGTTLKVARSLFRKSIGYEVNPDYKKIIDKKVASASPVLYRGSQYYCNVLDSIKEKHGYTFNIDFSSRKGILCLERNDGRKRAVVDLETTIDPRTFDIEKKKNENNIQNYLKGNGVWETVDNYIIVFKSVDKSRIMVGTKIDDKSFLFLDTNALFYHELDVAHIFGEFK